MSCILVSDPAAQLLRTVFEQLERHLCGQLQGRVSGFRILARGDGVVLQGRATSFHAKQVAQHAVMESLSVPILANEIEVSDTVVDWDD
jgi:hypothetical protein